MKKNKVASSKTEYDPNEWDESKAVRVNPEPQMKSGISTSIRLPRIMLAKLRQVAKRKEVRQPKHVAIPLHGARNIANHP